MKKKIILITSMIIFLGIGLSISNSQTNADFNSQMSISLRKPTVYENLQNKVAKLVSSPKKKTTEIKKNRSENVKVRVRFLTDDGKKVLKKKNYYFEKGSQYNIDIRKKN